MPVYSMSPVLDKKRRMGIVSAANGQNPAYSLPENYGFNDLANYEEARRNAFGNTASSDILNTRNNLSKSLTDYSSNYFKQQTPALLEDLNSRGLLTSPTEVANSTTQALKEMGLSNENYLRDFDTSALSARLQAQQDALDSGLDLRRGKLEGDLQTNQANREEALARDLAKQQGRNSLYSSLIGAGGSIGGPLLLAKYMGLGKTAATVPAIADVAGVGATGAGVTGASGAVGVGSGLGANPLSLYGSGGFGSAVPGAVPGAAPAAPAAGIGLGPALGMGAVGYGLAVGDNALKNTLKDKFGNTHGAAARVAINPVGSQINFAKNLATNPRQTLSRALGNAGGSIFGGKTANGNDIADASRSVQGIQQQLQTLKSQVANGQLSQEDYMAQAQPLVEQAAQTTGSIASRGGTYASAINKVWQDLLNSGVAKASSGRWVAA